MRSVKFRATLVGCLAAAVLATAAVGPPIDSVGVPATAIEQAQAQKPSGGSTSLKSSGDKGADLLSAIVGPLLIIGIGVLGLVALLQRNAGMALAAVAIGILAGLPIFAPGTVEGLMKDLYESVF